MVPGQPGGAVLVLKNDQILFEKGFGLATIDPPSPVTPATRFCIASVSKQFAAVATLKLAEAGKLSLEDPVSDYFPQFRADFFRRITLAHLMSHTSGIPDVRPRTDSHYVPFHRRGIACLPGHPQLSELSPGSSYEYINPTYQLLYTVVEKASGMSFEEYMRDQVSCLQVCPAYVFRGRKEHPIHGARYLYDSTANDWKEYDYGKPASSRPRPTEPLYIPGRICALGACPRNNTLLGEDMTRKAHTLTSILTYPKPGTDTDGLLRN